MGLSTPEEAAINQASEVWAQLPWVKWRQVQVASILLAEGVIGFTAEGITRALQINFALDQIRPLGSVVPWMQAQKMWPFEVAA